MKDETDVEDDIEIEIDDDGTKWIVFKSSVDKQRVEVKKEISCINNYLKNTKELLNILFDEISKIDDFANSVRVDKCFLYFFCMYNDEYIDKLYSFYLNTDEKDETYNKIRETFNTTIKSEILRSEDIHVDSLIRNKVLKDKDKIKMHIKNIKEISVQFYLLVKKTIEVYINIDENNSQQIIVLFFPLIVYSIMN